MRANQSYFIGRPRGSAKLIVLFILVVLISAGFGVAAGTRLGSAQVANAPASPATPVPAGSVDVEHLIEIQEAVLDQVARQAEHSRQLMDFAILTVGFVGSLVLVVFAYFGYNTARDAKEAKKDADSIKKELDTELRKAKSLQARIQESIEGELKDQLAHFTDYGLKVAEFTSADGGKMSMEDQLRNCEEALDALDKSGVGDRAHRARSFVLGRKGVAYSSAQRYTDALREFENAEFVNVARKPDRPFNVACCCSRLSAISQVEAEALALRQRAIQKLKECLELAKPDVPIESTISKAYFLSRIRDGEKFDPDLTALKGFEPFEELRAVGEAQPPGRVTS